MAKCDYGARTENSNNGMTNTWPKQKLLGNHSTPWNQDVTPQMLKRMLLAAIMNQSEHTREGLVLNVNQSVCSLRGGTLLYECIHLPSM